MKEYIPKDVRWWEKLILFFRCAYTTPWRNGHRLKVKRWRGGWYVVGEEAFPVRSMEEDAAKWNREFDEARKK